MTVVVHVLKAPGPEKPNGEGSASKSGVCARPKTPRATATPAPRSNAPNSTPRREATCSAILVLPQGEPYFALNLMVCHPVAPSGTTSAWAEVWV